MTFSCQADELEGGGLAGTVEMHGERSRTERRQGIKRSLQYVLRRLFCGCTRVLGATAENAQWRTGSNGPT